MILLWLGQVFLPPLTIIYRQINFIRFHKQTLFIQQNLLRYLTVQICAGSVCKRKVRIFICGWSCLKAQNYWDMVCNFILKALNFKIDKKRTFVLLLALFNKDLPRDLHYVLSHIIVAARLLKHKLGNQPKFPLKINYTRNYESVLKWTN